MENLYAREYVNHYKKLGYSHIYIYDNNDINDEKFEDVIQDEIDSGFVTIKTLEGKSKVNVMHIRIVMKNIINYMIGYHFSILMNFYQ